MVLGLIAMLFVTQMLSGNSINRLVKGNEQAAVTFMINNRLEELVNMSFELESKMINAKYPPAKSYIDSIGLLQDKTIFLQELMAKKSSIDIPERLFALTKSQADFALSISKSPRFNGIEDSIRVKHFGDSIYLQALNFQKNLELTLSEVLNENNRVAGKVSMMNKILAFSALLAILILATIIIRRQIFQYKLIHDLNQAREMALQSANIKDQFLANMSHEIRTPLNALKGFSKLLSKTTLNDEQKQFTTLINQSSDHLLHVVNDILDFSKMESDAVTLKKVPLNLTAILSELELTYSPMASEKGLALIMNADKGISESLAGDPERLKQVLVNLLGNAIKFTEEGRVVLNAKLLHDHADRQEITLSVADTGIGIPENQRALVFDRFEQLNNSFVRQYGGTGLGLAISQMIVEHMNSKIAIESNIPSGSVFSFTVVFDKIADFQQVEISKPNSIIPSVTDPALRRVLVVEDNKVNSLLVRKILSGYQLDVTEVANGEEAISMMKDSSFDLVLMDVQMPRMDGFTCTRYIRNQLHSGIPIVGMTAYVLPAEIEKCFEAGMNDYVPKPIEESFFLSVISRFVFLSQQKDKTMELHVSNPAPDMEYLLKLCNNNHASVLAVLREIIAQLPGDMDNIMQSSKQMDTLGLKKALHHVQSTITPLGHQSRLLSSVKALQELIHGDNQPDWAEINRQTQHANEMVNTVLDYCELYVNQHQVKNG